MVGAAWFAQRCDKTRVSSIMRVAWVTVGDIVARMVKWLRAPIDPTKVAAVGADELSRRKGHRYLTMVTDLPTLRIIWASEGRLA